MSKIEDSDKPVKTEKQPQMPPILTSPSALSDLDFMFNRWVNSFFPGGFHQPVRLESPMWQEISGTRTPKIDVVDREDSVVVRAEIPGVKKDDLEVTITDTRLTIKGGRKSELSEEKDSFYRCEISRGSFLRTISLPENVDSDKVRANFNDGILELTLPKSQKSKRRSVKIE